MNSRPFHRARTTDVPAFWPSPRSISMPVRGRCGSILALGILLAVGGVASGAVLNDTAFGPGTVLGNALNPGPARDQPQDANWKSAKHTPSGLMFQIPFAVSDPQRTAREWEYSGQIQFGVLGGDADEESARFRTYQDIDNGAYLNNFSLNLSKPERGYTLELTGGGAGRRDQYYGVQVGRANAWKLKLFFNEIPHVFTNRFGSLWNGTGTGNIFLVPGLTPGGTASTPADNTDVTSIALARRQDLSMMRKQVGIRLDLDLSSTWKAYAGYTLENRKGARPLGSVWGNSGGTAPLELAEPIDYDTADILGGLSFVSGLNTLNLRATASLFRNNISTLTFEEPFRIPPANGVTTVPAAGAFTEGQFDLTPSNQAYNARAEYNRAMPDFYQGYFTVVASAGTWRQDDTLIPYTVTPNVTQANVTLLTNGNWDALSTLSRRSADAVIDTRLLDITFALNPTPALNVKAKARYYETDNNTNPFLSLNPNAVNLDVDAGTPGNQSGGLTLDGVAGVWGRPLNDASGQSILFGTNTNPAGNIPIKSLPYSSRQYRFGPTFDYRWTKAVTFNGSIEREIMRRTHRDRDRTVEDKLKLGLVNRSLGDSTFRASWQYGRRHGGEYRPSVYGEGFSTMLVPIPTANGANVTAWVRTNSGFRNLDLANRDQHVVNTRLDTSLRPDVDAGLSYQWRQSAYPESVYGLTRSDQDSVNLDLNYQPSPRRTIYGFYSFQRGRNHQASIASANANVVIGQPSEFGVITPEDAVAIGSAPGGPLYPLLNAWTAKSTDRNHVAGFGFRQDFRAATFNLDYSYATGRTRIGYTYNVGGALNAANAEFAGNRMPDLAIDTDYLDASVRIPITAHLAARLVYRFQKETIRDWHYRNVDTTPIAPGGNNPLPTAVILDAGPQDYSVNWFGVIFQLQLERRISPP